MRYFESKKRLDGKWDFTCNGIATGYCAGFPSLDNKYNLPDWEEYVAKCEANRVKYHTCGHDTAEEAWACYAVYEIDNTWREWDSSNTQSKCEICGCWTSHIVEIGHYSLYRLCPDHATIEVIGKLHSGSPWMARS
jgi:hypothetical protein